MTAQRDQRLRLRDILLAADKILERTAEGWGQLEGDELVQVWVVHHLEVIGEAAARVDADIKRAHPEVDWIAAAHTRNRLVHGYFDMDLELIWTTVERDIPRLREQIAAILEGMPGVDAG